MKRIGLSLITLFLIGCMTPKGGIGIGFDRKGLVHIVFKGSPAEQSGIRVDDKLLKPFPKPGAIGSMCKVKWTRGDKQFEKSIKRVDMDKLRSW